MRQLTCHNVNKLNMKWAMNFKVFPVYAELKNQLNLQLLFYKAVDISS